jgi:hypothetical protein
MGGKDEGWGKRVGKKGQNKLLGQEEIDFSTGERRRVNGVRIGLRR